MANLTINIVTKYADAEKGFSKVAGSLTKYRNELLKANAEGKVTEQNWANYKQALNNALIEQDLTKDGMAKLTAQAKILGKELGQIGMAFGENDETYKRLDELLTNVKKDMAGLTDETSKMGGKFGDTGLKLLSVAKNILKFQLLIGPITALVRGFRNTLSDSVKVAAEAEQIFSKLSTVFDGFGDSAKRMASTLASSIGVANSTAASALSTVGDLLQAQGMGTSESLSTASEWVRQFQDIIAFKDINMSLEEFAQNFMSGAAGNLRNFRTFGSIVKESAVNAELAAKGLDKLTGSELELAKMTTRAEMALEQQKNAMGATEREWDTMLSVNRRYNEAQKQLKENLGDMMNAVLKPVKSWWTQILEEINKATKAQKEFANGSKNIKVYDIENNAKDAQTFKNNLLGAYNALNSQSLFVGQTVDGVTYGSQEEMAQTYLSSLNAQIVMFGATVEDAARVLGDKLTPDMKEYLEVLEKQRKEELANTDFIEKQLGKIQGRIASADSLMETIANITGARGGMDIQDTSWLATMKSNVNGDSWVASWIKDYVDGNIEGALKSIDSADLKSFGDLISGELGDLNDGDLLKNKAEAYRQFFEAVHNYFGKDGDFSAEELATLENIKKAYKDTNEEAKKYQERLEAEAGIKGHIGNAQDVLWEAATRARFARAGVSSDQMSIWIKYEKALEELNKQFTELGKETVEINGETYDQTKAIDLLKEARQAEIDAIKKEEEEVTKLSEIIAQGIFGENASAGYAQKFSSAVANSTGGQVVQAGMDGGVVGILVEILTQTETFTETLKSFDPIITTFSEFIKPILPAVQLIFNVINELVFSILKPFFPIIKGIAMVVASLAYPIKIVTNVIKNIYTAVHNILERITHPISGGDRWNYVSLADGVDEITGIIRDIKNMTFDIKQNTDPDNSELLKAYTQMRDKGMITGTEWEALVSGLSGVSYDRMRTYGSNAWQNGKGGTTIIYYGDLKFTIDGTNLSAEEIAEAVTRKQKEWAGNGQYA